jgi:hypothetical protein
MNPQLIAWLVSQRVSEVRQQATSCQLAAADREPRESVKERAGWALINAGLKLTGAPNPRQHAWPRPADL